MVSFVAAVGLSCNAVGKIKHQDLGKGLDVQKIDNTIHQINHYPALGSIICFVNTYPLSDLSRE